MVDAYFSADPLTFQIGDAVTGGINPVVLDIFATLQKENGRELSGIIGHDIMRNYVVTFDYPNQRIAFESK